MNKRARITIYVGSDYEVERVEQSGPPLREYLTEAELEPFVDLALAMRESQIDSLATAS